MPGVKERRESTIEAKRKSYWEIANQLLSVEDDQRSEYERGIYHQIMIDVPRTSPTLDLFQSPDTQKMYLRILYVWAIRHPASGYVQGINDLVTPFFSAFIEPYLSTDISNLRDLSSVPEDVIQSIEADCYWCLSKFIDGIQDHYTFAQPGIQRMIYKLKELVQKLDAPLDKHLTNENTEYIQFAFRWMNCLLMREFPLRLVQRMWDTYLSEGESFAILHVYTCAAFLVRWRKELIQEVFPQIMTLIQNLPTKDWDVSDIETLLSQAYVWKVAYNQSNHLKSNKPPVN
eukprot:TRINITY_DN2047_c0_g3_i2.p1 TRINITY_DN2047_c0_g3~~TRINITY_DN2047_c0_g3_i2.p1  ORF type:complete len:288 (+),score=53.83 TRINITY_DN2047_c0_g3_i2:570-1433(+)